MILVSDLEQEASAARMTRGNIRRPYLSAREQRYGAELSKRYPHSLPTLLHFLRRLRPGVRPKARRLLEVALATNIDPAEVLEAAEIRSLAVVPIAPSPLDARAVTASLLAASLLYDTPEQLRRRAKEGR